MSDVGVIRVQVCLLNPPDPKSRLEHTGLRDSGLGFRIQGLSMRSLRLSLALTPE